MQGPEGASVRDTTGVEERGIVPRAVQMITEQLQQRNTKSKIVSFSLTMSCYEIYNETVRDLLSPDNTESQSTKMSKWEPVQFKVESQ